MNNRNIKPISPFILFCQKVIPLAFDESMSYYECLCALTNYLYNEVIPAVNNNADVVDELKSLFNELKDYVENYFKETDFQEYVNNKLDEMVKDGTLENIINMEVFNEKVNVYNQESSMNRVYRLITSSYNHIGAIHNFNDALYVSIDNGINSMVYKLDKLTYETLASTVLNYKVTDICNFNDAIIILDGSNTIKSYDKNSLIFGGIINLSINVKYCEFNNDTLYYLVTDNNKFKTTTDFVTISEYNLEIDCNGIAIKNNELYILNDNDLQLYENNSVKRIYNQELIINNGYVKGTSTALTVDNDKFIIGTFKKIIPIREDYIISLYEMNLSKDVKKNNKLLNYNSTRNEFEIYFDSSNTSVNPDGSIDDPFSNIYECIEVALNGNYNKGNIMFKNSGEELSDVFISDMYKKCGLYFNGATVHGLLIRNSNKIELNNVTIDDEYLTDSCCLEIINGDVVLTDTVTINNTKSLENVVECAFHSNLVCLNPITTGNILSRTGSVVITRNNSLYDKKVIGDRYSKFMPNMVALSPTNISAGTTVTIDNLNFYSKLLLRVNAQAQFTWFEIPALDGTYSLPVCITHNNKMYIGNLKVTISGNNFTVNTRSLYNLSDGVTDNTLTFRINNIFGVC